jgi:TusA-related sulfurtransferase
VTRILPDHPALVPDAVIDVTADLCPMTFVRTRLALDRLRPGQVLRVDLRGAEPRENVPRSARELGHAILAEHSGANGVTTIFIRKT